MPIDIRWDDEEHTILYGKIVSPLAWPDFHIGMDKCGKLINESTDLRGILFDIREGDEIPPSGFIKQLRQVLRNAPDVPIVLIGDPEIMKVIFAPVFQLSLKRRKFHFVSTLAEGRTAIQSSHNNSKKIM